MNVTIGTPVFSHRILSHLPPDACSALTSISRQLVVNQSVNVFDEGAQVDGLYILTTGLIKITRLSVDGDQQLIDILAQGNIVGEIALCDDGPRSATATAIVDSKFLYLPKKSFFECANRHPVIYRELLSTLSERLRVTNNSFARNQFLPVAGQVAAVLLHLAETMGKSENHDSIVIDHPLTHKDIASMIGAARENVSRVIGQLKKQGVIQTTHNTLTLQDIKHLQSMSLI